jgi:hypothetical protein
LNLPGRADEHHTKPARSVTVPAKIQTGHLLYSLYHKLQFVDSRVTICIQVNVHTECMLQKFVSRNFKPTKRELHNTFPIGLVRSNF